MLYVSGKTHQRSNISRLSLLTWRSWQSLQDRGEKLTKNFIKYLCGSVSEVTAVAFILPAIRWVLGLLGILWILRHL